MSKKDPAFLFYSKDFYEGTRLMLPEERACLIDLMIYQHQHEFIPNDLKRIMMYCSGVDKATLEATLEAKFELTDKGWVNKKLALVVDERKEFSSKQSENGIIGQFFKKAKQGLSINKYKDLTNFIYTKYTKVKLLEDLKNNGNNYEALLEALLKHLEDVIVIVDVNKDINKKGSVDSTASEVTEGEGEKITFSEFWKKYPKKVAKTDCEKKFKKLSKADISKIAKTIDNFIAYKPFEKYNHPNPMTYLNQERWNDESEEVKPMEIEVNGKMRKVKFYKDDGTPVLEPNLAPTLDEISELQTAERGF